MIQNTPNKAKKSTYNSPNKSSLTKPATKKRGMTKLSTVWITRPSQKRFEENYIKIKQIGEPGSFGKAYQIKRKSDGKILAVKEISKAKIYRLHPSDNMRQSLLKSMEAEIDIMRRLHHKYIVNMFETYETKHTLHIIMEECRGGELFDRIKQRGRYNENDCKLIIKQICEALFYMHDKHRVVHCDLKPDNILFVNNNEKSNIKIIDFGMSKVLPRLRSLKQLCGTPYYTAPEIISGKYSHACDMWSVGVITYVMIFGFPPFYVDPNMYYGIKETKQIYKLILKGFNPIIKSGYGAWFPKSLKSRLSKMGMDFITSLIEKDIGKRLTAKEALQHPWLNNVISNELDDDEKKDINLNIDINATPFANFCISSKFKYAVSRIFREQYKHMRPKHFENLKILFSQLDTDGNGKISYSEFEEGMLKCKELKLNSNKIKQMFNELDINNKGEIEFENLLDATVHDYLIASDVRLYEAFRDLDSKETGKIPISLIKQKIYEINPYDNIDHILSIIDDVDKNNDGMIDYSEFLRALHPDFNQTPNWFWKNTTIFKHPEIKDDDESTSSSNEIDEEYDNYTSDIVSNQPKLVSDVDESFVKQGWMQKEGKVIRNWKLRYFKLQKNGIMGYYHNENEEYAIATFNVKKLTKLKNKSWGKTNKKRYGIKIYTPHRDWRFLCKNNQERSEWIKCIAQVADDKKPTVKPSRSK